MSATDIKDVVKNLTLPELRQQLRSRGLSPAGSLDVLKQRLTDNMMETHDLSIKRNDQGPVQVQDDGDYRKNNYSRVGGNQNIGNRITDRPSSKVLAPPGGWSQISFGSDVPAAGPGSSDPAAHAAAEALLAKMGLGDTDRLLSSGPDVVAARPTDTAHKLSVEIDYLLKNLMVPDLRSELRHRGLSPAGSADALRNRLGDHMAATGDLALNGVVATPSTPAAVIASAPASSNIFGSDTRANNNYARPGGQQNVGNFLTDRPSSKVLAPPGGKSQITFG